LLSRIEALATAPVDPRWRSPHEAALIGMLVAAFDVEPRLALMAAERARNAPEAPWIPHLADSIVASVPSPAGDGALELAGRYDTSQTLMMSRAMGSGPLYRVEGALGAPTGSRSVRHGVGMIRHVFSVLCQRLLVDPATGVFSLVDCVERILLPPVNVEPGKTLLVPVGMRILSLWTRDPTDEPSAARARLTLQTPMGATFPGGETELNLRRRTATRERTPRCSSIPSRVRGATGTSSNSSRPVVSGRRSRASRWTSTSSR
jgi:hypothetical protein